MKERSLKLELLILFSCFVVSRVIVKQFGVSFEFKPLFEYWQYLDTTSLSGNLLQSLFYQHSQPPVFNLLLGIILKCGGSHAATVFEYLLMAITFFNGFLILRILRNTLLSINIPLIMSLVYLLSPATILFENELFYTTFISMLLLLAVNYMVKYTHTKSLQNVIGIFVSLSLVCLTKSMYHLVWLLLISVMLLYIGFRRKGFKRTMMGAVLSIVVVGGWYAKNYMVFNTFSASSWTGMNLARIVFQNAVIRDSVNIATVHPFMPISYYKNYISLNYEEKYKGFDDRILLMETKNDNFINMNNAGYLQVSKQYMEASKKQVLEHPKKYLKNIFTSFIIFFTPASSYFKVANNEKRIWYYDLIYSFNPSHFFKDHHDEKLSLAIAAIPKFVIYCLVFFMLCRNDLRESYQPAYNVFIITTIIFTIVASSLFEYGENMRFRYEIEPIFLILAGQAIASLKRSK